MPIAVFLVDETIRLSELKLKDRRDRVLEFHDICQYQKVIVALTATARLIAEIDKTAVEGSGKFKTDSSVHA